MAALGSAVPLPHFYIINKSERRYCIMKQCSKCKEWKDESEFHKDKSKKNGLHSSCKKCMNQKNREWKKNNKEYRNEKERERYESNIEEERRKERERYESNIEEERRKERERYESNIEKISQRKKNYRHSPLEYNLETKMRKEIELYEEVRKSENGNVEVRCANCENWFEPIKGQIKARLDAIKGMTSKGTENRLYCSDECKSECPIYGQRRYKKGYKPTHQRIDQPDLRQIVLKENEYTCIWCGKFTDGSELICHHIEPVVCNPVESADVDNCILLCEDCHNKVHDQNGCRLNDLRNINKSIGGKHNATKTIY